MGTGPGFQTSKFFPRGWPRKDLARPKGPFLIGVWVPEAKFLAGRFTGIYPRFNRNLENTRGNFPGKGISERGKKPDKNFLRGTFTGNQKQGCGGVFNTHTLWLPYSGGYFNTVICGHKNSSEIRGIPGKLCAPRGLREKGVKVSPFFFDRTQLRGPDRRFAPGYKRDNSWDIFPGERCFPHGVFLQTPRREDPRGEYNLKRGCHPSTPAPQVKKKPLLRIRGANEEIIPPG